MALQEPGFEQSVADVVRSSKGVLSVFHVRNLQTTLWFDLYPAIAQYLSNLSSKPIEVVPSWDCIQRVRSDIEFSTAGDTSTDQVSAVERALATTPAAKLLHGYESMLLHKDGKGVAMSC